MYQDQGFSHVTVPNHTISDTPLLANSEFVIRFTTTESVAKTYGFSVFVTIV